MKSIVFALLMILTSGKVAVAACTPEDVQVKAQKFMDIAMVLAQKAPDRYAEVAQALQTELPELQKLEDLDGLCGFYDKWIEKMR